MPFIKSECSTVTAAKEVLSCSLLKDRCIRFILRFLNLKRKDFSLRTIPFTATLEGTREWQLWLLLCSLRLFPGFISLSGHATDFNVSFRIEEPSHQAAILQVPKLCFWLCVVTWSFPGCHGVALWIHVTLVKARCMAPCLISTVWRFMPPIWQSFTISLV